VERARSIQAELLVSLGLVMIVATALVALALLKMQAAESDRMKGLVGAALVGEARSPTFGMRSDTGLEWWSVAPDGSASPRASAESPLGPAERELAANARSVGAPLLQPGAPWQALRFAVPIGSAGEVAVARSRPVVPTLLVLGLFVAGCAVFTGLGVVLLRRRVVEPLQRLAAAARWMGEEGPGVRVQVEGVSEAAEVAQAFNEMSEALESRTSSLEKAVVELRATNGRLRHARDGLDRAERLAAVGSLAAGVAHEVGNPMGALLAFLDLVGRDDTLRGDTRAKLLRAVEQGERVRTILRQLLDFSRPPQANRMQVDLARAAEQCISLVRAQKEHSHIDFRVATEPGARPVLADEALVGQMLLNLVVNAAQALREIPGPRIELRVRPCPLRLRSGDAGISGGLARREPDAMACDVLDNGPGVPAEDRERIFDPFFTSKPPGEGTGLGLANVQRLAQELGGRVEYREGEGAGEAAGACFRLVLPVDGGPQTPAGPATRCGVAAPQEDA